jgi:hypothetical protein
MERYMAARRKMRGMNEQLRIIVLGYLVRGPMGGMVTSNLQYLLGLSRLGHDVYFLEDSEDYESCYNPVTMEMGTDPTYGLAFADRALAPIGLGDQWVYWDAHRSRWLGPAADHITEVCSTADLLLNLCGVNPLRPWLQEVPARILVDEDPAFTQIRHLTDPLARERALQHTAFFSFGENIRARDMAKVASSTISRASRIPSRVPDDGLPWRPTRQPVVLEAWPVSQGPKGGKFRTLMQWDSYPAMRFHGVRYGLKCDSFGPYMDLPRSTGDIFDLAIARLPDEIRRRLQDKGWRLSDPSEPSRDPESYQRFLQASKAEFSVAKQGYVVSRSGWFSERSACYLASGRPVVLQETGFSDWLPTGEGIFSFDNPAEAVVAIKEVNRRYEFHCQAARQIAEEFFDARQVLPRLLDLGLKKQGSEVRDQKTQIQRLDL